MNFFTGNPMQLKSFLNEFMVSWWKYLYWLLTGFFQIGEKQKVNFCVFFFFKCATCIQKPEFSIILIWLSERWGFFLEDLFTYLENLKLHRKRERFLPPIGSLARWLKQAALGQTKARSQLFSPDLFHEWHGPKRLDHLPSFPKPFPRSYIGNDIARPWTDTSKGCKHNRQWFYSLSHNAKPQNTHIFFLLLRFIIFLFQRQREGELERGLPSSGLAYKWLQWPELNWYKAGNQELLLGLPDGGKVLRIWAILPLFS